MFVVDMLALPIAKSPTYLSTDQSSSSLAKNGYSTDSIGSVSARRAHHKIGGTGCADLQHSAVDGSRPTYLHVSEALGCIESGTGHVVANC